MLPFIIALGSCCSKELEAALKPSCWELSGLSPPPPALPPTDPTLTSLRHTQPIPLPPFWHDRLGKNTGRSLRRQWGLTLSIKPTFPCYHQKTASQSWHHCRIRQMSIQANISHSTLWAKSNAVVLFAPRSSTHSLATLWNRSLHAHRTYSPLSEVYSQGPIPMFCIWLTLWMYFLVLWILFSTCTCSLLLNTIFYKLTQIFYRKG